MAILLAMLAGVSIVLSRIVNFVLSEKIGLFQSTFFNYLTGFLGSLVLVVISGETFALFAPASYQGSWWAYIGGAVGVGVITLSSYLSSKISAFYLTLLLFVGQLFGGMVLDYFVSGDFSIQKVIGGILVVAGLGYNLWVDTKATHTLKDAQPNLMEGVSSI
ncbi:MAG: DMT family transporter [Cellulosilyticum sp.]|nr:DMT family transporter [Cellulosilyticum sp.]